MTAMLKGSITCAMLVGTNGPSAAWLTDEVTSVQIGDVTIAYELDGPEDGRPMLLLMGLGGQLVAWPQPFVDLLADKGFRVIRVDNRDIGLSSRTEAPPARVRDVARGYVHRRLARSHYQLTDMAADAVGVLDYLGVKQVDLVGLSMGAMIAQEVVIGFPHRVRSLVSIMGSTGRRRYGRVSPRLLAAMAREFRTPVPTTREAAIAKAVEGMRKISGPGFDADHMEELILRSIERSTDQAGESRQLLAIHASRDRTRLLQRVSVPTLVVHGMADPLVLPSGGVATARAIPGSRLLMFPDMGHDLPPSRLEEIADAIVTNTRRAAPLAPGEESHPVEPARPTTAHRPAPFDPAESREVQETR